MIDPTRREPAPPGWTLVAAVIAPVALIGGWLIAGAVQDVPFDPVQQTISALARHGADHRWVMTAGLGLLGLAYLGTAAGLRGVRPAARIVLALAGVTTLLVTVFAQPERGSSATHIAAATTGFVLLAVWPLTTAIFGAAARDAAPALRAPVAIVVSVVSIGLLAWVGVTQAGGPLGLAERLLTAQQALWPLAVVVSLRHARR